MSKHHMVMPKRSSLKARLKRLPSLNAHTRRKVEKAKDSSPKNLDSSNQQRERNKRSKRNKSQNSSFRKYIFIKMTKNSLQWI